MKSGALPERLLSKRGAVEGTVKTLKSYKVKRRSQEGDGVTSRFYFLAFARWCFVIPGVICCEPGKQ
jgi:hypothetical protein